MLVTVAHVLVVDEYLSHSPAAAGLEAYANSEVPYTAVLWPPSVAAFGIVACTAHTSPDVGVAVDGVAVDGVAVDGVAVVGVAVVGVAVVGVAVGAGVRVTV